MNYRNPIIQGFNPDPSICRVGEDYYLITSSFEYFPGIPIYHSRDLIHWKQIGNCLTRESQLPLRGVEPSGGIWAPTIRYHNGVFYVTSTNINGHGNFFVTATDPAGEWSEPVWLNIGGIDPSFTFDEGHVYYTVSHPNPEGGWGIAQAEIDITTGGLGELHHVWKGSGGKSPEAPHLYKIGDFYYLMIAEGGTYFTHMETIARSLSPWGPFESCPRNPILTNMQSLIPDVQCVGHGDLVQEPATDHFDGENLNPFWNHLRNPYPEDYSLSDPKGFLTLWGNPHTVDELDSPALLCRRQKYYECKISTLMDFAPQNENEEASLIVFLSNAFYFKLVKKKNDGKSVLILEKRADDFRQTVSCVDIEEVPVFLHIEADRLQYRFYYGYDKNEKRYLGSASARFLSCELAGRCFTGTFVGLYASGNGHRSKQPAHFDYFTLMNQEYSEKL